MYARDSRQREREPIGCYVEVTSTLRVANARRQSGHQHQAGVQQCFRSVNGARQPERV